MADIQFRWLEKGWDLNRGGRHIQSRDLQYRTPLKVSTSGEVTEWSNWKTVPTRFIRIEPHG